MRTLVFALIISHVLQENNVFVNGKVELSQRRLRYDEDAYLETPELIAKYGYPVETHEVKTSDDYLLTMHRIPNSEHQNVKASVFLMHGLLSSSIDYVLMGPGKSLAYILADEGYDVWMGNARGNVYSRKHVTLRPSTKAFWQFSWHEIGVHDLPAMIDYILNRTSATIYYIGHSQGTTSFYVMTSQLPQYNQKIRLMISLSPVVFMAHLKSPPVRILAPLGAFFKNFFDLIGGFEFQPRPELLKLSQRLCEDTAITQSLCSNVGFLFFGFDSDQLNKTALPVILSHLPAGASTKQFVHYGQLLVSGKFRQYDHGMRNIHEYHQWNPPDYNLKSVTAPIVLMYSTNDWLSDVKDVEKLYHLLPNVVLKYKVPHPKFNHMDYLYAIDAPKLLYNKVVELLPQF